MTQVLGTDAMLPAMKQDQQKYLFETGAKEVGDVFPVFIDDREIAE